uniref:Fatty acyl-CoA reductase C-terminal domain-containing protein n=1 Tax=Timema tahoe TaxID=61484 RepID=A0A7R9NXT0_9NEOP|nr:unnamed protein product [Timema tahoe]
MNEWTFKNTNLRDLLTQLPPKDRDTFNFDASNINVEEYVKNWVVGSRRFILRLDDSSIPEAKKKLRREGGSRGYTHKMHTKREKKGEGVVVDREHVMREPWISPEQCYWHLQPSSAGTSYFTLTGSLCEHTMLTRLLASRFQSKQHVRDIRLSSMGDRQLGTYTVEWGSLSLGHYTILVVVGWPIMI